MLYMITVKIETLSMSAALQIFPDISHIANAYSALLLDAYGVFWGGNEVKLLPGAKEMMEKCVSDGKIVGILSNSTQLASKEISKFKLCNINLGEHFHFVITSGEVAKDVFLNRKLPFETPRKRFWLFGGIHPKFSSHESIFHGSIFSETPHIHEADFIYISIPHVEGQDQTDPEMFRSSVEKLLDKKLPMVCPNPDLFAHEGTPPRSVVRQGSIAALYENMGGTVFYIGKPYTHAYSIAMNEFIKRKISAPSQILMVGDTPETDIRGARDFGMLSALVTQTGIMSDRILHRGLENAIEDLDNKNYPDYFIGRFGL
jgi:HAD superfamily hydrolase (TIGR01459 family)